MYRPMQNYTHALNFSFCHVTDFIVSYVMDYHKMVHYSEIKEPIIKVWDPWR